MKLWTTPPIMVCPPCVPTPTFEWKSGNGKLKWSCCVNMLPFVEAVLMLELIEGADEPIEPLPEQSFEPEWSWQPDIAEVWVCFCCWSCFVLRNRPPDPLALFIAWRWRDSWRYGWKDTDKIRHKFGVKESKHLRESWSQKEKTLDRKKLKFQLSQQPSIYSDVHQIKQILFIL